jgi:hypothetical protein
LRDRSASTRAIIRPSRFRRDTPRRAPRQGAVARLPLKGSDPMPKIKWIDGSRHHPGTSEPVATDAAEPGALAEQAAEQPAVEPVEQVESAAEPVEPAAAAPVVDPLVAYRQKYGTGHGPSHVAQPAQANANGTRAPEHRMSREEEINQRNRERLHPGGHIEAAPVAAQNSSFKNADPEELEIFIARVTAAVSTNSAARVLEKEYRRLDRLYREREHYPVWTDATRVELRQLIAADKFLDGALLILKTTNRDVPGACDQLRRDAAIYWRSLQPKSPSQLMAEQLAAKAAARRERNAENRRRLGI